MHAGDMFPGKQVPIMDASNGGSGLEYANTLRMAYSAVTDIDTIITGHSVQMDRDDLREMAAFVDGLVSAAKQAKAQGVSAADFVADWSPKPRFRGDFSMPAPASFQAWVQVIYDEIDAM